MTLILSSLWVHSTGMICIRISDWVTSDHWSWSHSSQRNESRLYFLHYFIIALMTLLKWIMALTLILLLVKTILNRLILPCFTSSSVNFVTNCVKSSYRPSVHVIPSRDWINVLKALARHLRPSWYKSTATSPLVRPGKLGCCCSPARSKSAQTNSFSSRISLSMRDSCTNCSGSFCFSAWPASWRPVVGAFFNCSLWSAFFT